MATDNKKGVKPLNEEELNLVTGGGTGGKAGCPFGHGNNGTKKKCH